MDECMKLKPFGEIPESFRRLKTRRCLLCRQDGIYSIPDVSKAKDLCRDATEAFRQDADAAHTPDVF